MEVKPQQRPHVARRDKRAEKIIPSPPPAKKSLKKRKKCFYFQLFYFGGGGGNSIVWRGNECGGGKGVFIMGNGGVYMNGGALKGEGHKGGGL